MKKQLFYLLIFLHVSTLFTMEEQRSNELAFFRPHLAQEDAEKLTEIGLSYRDQIREILKGKLNLADLAKKNAFCSDTQEDARLKQERIYKLNLDITIKPQNAYPFIYESALAFRSIPKEYKKYFDDSSVFYMKQAYFQSNISDPNYLEKQNNFRIALDYQSDRVFGEIAKKWYAYIVFKALQKELQALSTITSAISFSEQFHKKINSLYNKLENLQTMIYIDPLAIVAIMEKMQRMKSSIDRFEKIIHLNDSEQEAFNHTNQFFNTVAIDYENLIKLLT